MSMYLYISIGVLKYKTLMLVVMNLAPGVEMMIFRRSLVFSYQMWG